MKMIKKLVASTLMAMMFVGGSLVQVKADEELQVELSAVINEIEANTSVSAESEALKKKNLDLIDKIQKDINVYEIRVAYLDEKIQIAQTKIDKLENLKPENFLQAAFLTVSNGYERLKLSDQLAAIHSDLKSFERFENGVLNEKDRLAIKTGLEEKILTLNEEKTMLTGKISENQAQGIALDNEIINLTEKITEVASEVETLNVRKMALEEEVRVEEELIRQAELERQRDTTFIMPTSGRLTSGYGNRIHPITRRSSFHTGIDLANSSGTSVNASRNGVVTFAGYQGTYGNFIIVRHSDGSESAYAHLSSILVSVGQSVTQGEQIGKMGSTGRSTGSHLHFEIRINGSHVDPYSYLQ